MNDQTIPETEHEVRLKPGVPLMAHPDKDEDDDVIYMIYAEHPGRNVLIGWISEHEYRAIFESVPAADEEDSTNAQ